MAVLTLKSDEYKYGFPTVLKEYAGYTTSIKGNAEKTVCEYLLDLRTFFRYLLSKDQKISPESDEFLEIDIRVVDVAYVKNPPTKNLFKAMLIFIGLIIKIYS